MCIVDTAISGPELEVLKASGRRKSTIVDLTLRVREAVSRGA
jgi:hypothetical protein